MTHSKQMSGGHLEKKVLDDYWYILPICQTHNHKKYDRGRSGGVMKTNAGSTAIKIPTLKNTPPFLVNYAESSSSVTILTVQIGQNSSVEDTLSPAISGLVKEVIEKQAGTAMKRMLKEPFSIISNAIKQAGEETKTFTDDYANDVELIMLIPFYGWVKGGIMLSEMKEKCLAYFNQRAAALVGEKMSNVRAVMMSQLLNIVMDIKSSADWKIMTERVVKILESPDPDLKTINQLHIVVTDATIHFEVKPTGRACVNNVLAFSDGELVKTNCSSLPIPMQYVTSGDEIVVKPDTESFPSITKLAFSTQDVLKVFIRITYVMKDESGTFVSHPHHAEQSQMTSVVHWSSKPRDGGAWTAADNRIKEHWSYTVIDMNDLDNSHFASWSELFSPV